MSDIVSVYGSRGTGKSTKARALVKSELRVVVLDPSRDWQKNAGWNWVADLPALSKLIAKKWRTGFRVVYTAPPGCDALALHRISDMLCQYQHQLYTGHASQEVTLVVDEMAEAYSNADAQNNSLSGFRRIILQGRHYGISVVGISQRPADVAARFRDNCARSYVFALHDHTSREAIIARIGKAYAEQLRNLPEFACLAIDRGSVKLEKLSQSLKKSGR